MTFDPPLRRATLIRRYKRFLADVVIADNPALTVHCANTGAMLGCADPGATVWLSDSDNPKRKYRYSWELVSIRGGVLVGINTSRSNALVREAIGEGVIEQLAGYASVKSEVRYARESSRADFMLTGGVREQRETAAPCMVEVKNVTAAVQRGVALFPDAVSVRASRHLRELAQVVAHGGRAVLCYCVQRDDVDEVRPASDIDPAYARGLRDAARAGVEVIAYAARVKPTGVTLYREVAVGGL